MLCSTDAETCLGSSLANRFARMVPSTAAPKAEPSVRVNMTTDVAAPISARGTEFCTVIVSTGLPKPFPRPTSTMNAITTTVGVSAPTRDNKRNETAITGRPNNG